ncbi:MAG: efflux RND transporter periplasmic adaptor subunit [Proteobacteria bacterium]|nr:efflux RND transporter periplasmic adaptor subunit [Pseudomonadota bacterium]
MSRVLPIFLGLGVIGAFLLTVAFLVVKAREVPVEYDTVHAELADIVKKTVATGAIVPRNEVEIKSRVSGVVDRMAVEPGDIVAAGDLIAVIRIIPNVQSLASAQSGVERAKIGVEQARTDLARDESLFERQVISTSAIASRRSDFALAEEQYKAALRTLRIVREGHAGGAGGVANEVRSTVAGMVLTADVKAGESVTETNTFNAGTTIATVADMSDLIFEGQVDESEVGRIKEGMELDVTVGALDNQKLKGTLEYIAPKGALLDGAVQFAIEAAIVVPAETFVRAGSSANAAIVLDKREQVLALPESVLQFEGKEPYVEIETGTQRFERREVELGLSDGIRIEVLGGVTAEDAVKAGVRGG